MKWVRLLVDILLSWIWGATKRSAALHVKEQTLLVYLKTLQGVRLSVLGGVVLLLVIQLMALGFFALIGAGIYFAPWENELKAYVLFGSAGVLFLLPLTIFMYALSERFWLRMSGAQQMLKELQQTRHE